MGLSTPKPAKNEERQLLKVSEDGEPSSGGCNTILSQIAKGGRQASHAVYLKGRTIMRTEREPEMGIRGFYGWRSLPFAFSSLCSAGG